MEDNNTLHSTPNNKEIVLRTENLVKRYGKRTVVNEVSFNVKQGEIVGLLGPNGAGKTTSFYMTTGLVESNGGRIFLGEQDITSFPVYKRAKAGIA
jgi:lipopolysaccharide export system ATP-binding protein